MPASRPLSGWGESMGVIITPACLPTGSTAERPLLGVRTGVAAAWTEATAVAIATAVGQAPSAVKDPSLKRGWGPVWLP